MWDTRNICAGNVNSNADGEASSHLILKTASHRLQLPPGERASCVAFDDDSVYAGTFAGALFKWTFGGM